MSDNLLWYGIKALDGTCEDATEIEERLEDVVGIVTAGIVMDALRRLGADEIEEGSR